MNEIKDNPTTENINEIMRDALTKLVNTNKF
jgi:hypothetical protein